jgi:hypothetical protein
MNVESEHLVFAMCIDVDPAVENEFNDWYSNEHLPAVVACPGIVSGRRYTGRVIGPDGATVQRYWAFYEVESKEAMTSPEIEPLAREGFGRFTESVRNMERFWFTPVPAEAAPNEKEDEPA